MPHVQTVPIIDYLHEYAWLPFLERAVNCPEKGGEGNTSLNACQECERYSGMKDTAWDHKVLCLMEDRKREKQDYNVGANIGKRGRHKMEEKVNGKQE
jgi:hypothetical protein